MQRWQDLVDFEAIEVTTSAAAQAAIAPRLCTVTVRSGRGIMRAMAEKSQAASLQALIARAARHAGVEAGVACAGTAIESRTLKVGGKAFAFFRPGNIMLKLGASLPEAKAKAAAEPTRFRAGAGGWVTVLLDGGALPVALLQRWLDESHALFAAATPKPRRPTGRKAAARPRRRAP